MLEDLVRWIIIMYIVVDPIGNIPLFLAVIGRLREEARARVVRLSVVVAASVLALFAVMGELPLAMFGITRGDFMLASGIVLLAIALNSLVKPYELPREAEPANLAVVPLAIPFLAGPASITMAMNMALELGVAPALLVVAVVSVLTYMTLLGATKIQRFLGNMGLLVVEKIMLLIVAALGASMVRRGLVEALT